MSTTISRIEIISSLKKFSGLKKLLSEIGVSGMTVAHVMGCGTQKGAAEYEDEYEEIELREKQLITLFVPSEKVEKIIELVKQELYTGHIGDGKIFVSDVTNVVRVRTGDEGLDAI
jgi:nitrogen regulatory protein PII